MFSWVSSNIGLKKNWVWLSVSQELEQDREVPDLAFLRLTVLIMSERSSAPSSIHGCLVSNQYQPRLLSSRSRRDVLGTVPAALSTLVLWQTSQIVIRRACDLLTKNEERTPRRSYQALWNHSRRLELVHRQMRALQRVWGGTSCRNLGVASLLPPFGPWDKTQDARLSRRHLYPLSHLMGLLPILIAKT